MLTSRREGLQISRSNFFWVDPLLSCKVMIFLGVFSFFLVDSEGYARLFFSPIGV